MPGEETRARVERAELRLGARARGRVVLGADGVAELIIEAPVPESFALEGREEGGAWTTLATVSTATLPPADPRDGIVASRRTFGASSSEGGALSVDAAPERSALAPPARGALWVRVERAGLPVEGALVSVTAEAGLAADPPSTTTDVAGLARLPVEPVAPPVVVSVRAEAGGASATWRGVVGAVLGVAVPTGDAIAPPARPIELVATSSRGDGYFDLWQQGARISGGTLTFRDGRASIALPTGVKGVVDLEVSSSPRPSSAEDLAHAMTWPLVVADDYVDAWAAIATSPRFTDRGPPPVGSLSAYRSIVPALLARAPVAVPHREVVADGLARALGAEKQRVRRVRGAATVSVIGGALAELGLMIGLGVLSRREPLDDAIRALEGAERGERSRRAHPLRSVAALVVAGIGVMVVVFASLAIMAWGLP